jgi:rhodanese-related sulfurtransferase
MDKPKMPIALRFFYLILLILFAVFLILKVLPEKDQAVGMTPDKLLSAILSQERYISTDEIADMIINRDPSIRLIDLRDQAIFDQYALPDAIHVPFPQLLEEKYDSILFQDQYDLVFISNDHLYADQAWALCTRLGLKHAYVLEGGMNAWFETIINPAEPREEMPEEAFELYAARKAASLYFGVHYPEPIPEVVKAPVKRTPKKVVPVKKKKKLPVEGGC